MKANASQIRGAIERPSSDVRLYLLHGPDESGAGDLARLLATAMGKDAERIDLDGATLKADPARLADEAASMGLFGEKRFIRISATGEESLAALTALLEAERAGNPVVALAPTVKTSAKIVKLATDSRQAMAFACYAPSAADAEKLAASIARDHGLRVANGVARRLSEASGGDRAVMAREIEKLALYLDADIDRPADLDDDALDMIGADLGDVEIGQAVEALIEGKPDMLGQELTMLTEAGTSPIPLLRQIARRLIALSDMRVEIDRGDAVDTVMKRHRIFYKEEAATTGALRRWTPAMLATALARVRRAERAIMATANAGPVLADAAMLSLGRDVSRRR